MLLIYVTSSKVREVDKERVNNRSRKVSLEDRAVFYRGEVRHVLESMDKIEYSAIIMHKKV